MRATFIVLSLLTVLSLGGCGVKGSLKTPPPLFSKKAPATNNAQANGTNATNVQTSDVLASDANASDTNDSETELDQLLEKLED